MSSEHELTRTVRSWLEDGVNVLPDRVLDDVLAQVPVTQQRRVTWWPARRVIDMSNSLRWVGAAAAVIVLVVIVGFGTGFLGPRGVAAPVNTATPTAAPAATPAATPAPSPTPAPTPTPTPSPIALSTIPEGTTLEPGTYLMDAPFSVPYTVTFEDQWDTSQTFDELSGFFKTGATDGNASVAVMVPENVIMDPCNSESAIDPPVEKTVDGFVAALTNLVGWDAGAVRETPVGNLTGKTFVLTPPFTDGAQCNGGLPNLVTYLHEPFAGPGTNTDLYAELTVVDVDGTPVIIISEWHGATPSESRAAMEQVARSIKFE